MHTGGEQTTRGSRHHSGLARSGTCVGVLVLVFALLSWATPPGVWGAVFQIPAGDVPGLIAAIHAANANGEANTIFLEAGLYTLRAVDNATDGPNGLPSITSTLTLIGAGAEATIIERAAGVPFFRLIHVAATGNLYTQRVTLRGRAAVSDPLGGSGIFNRGTLTLTLSTLTDNGSVGPSPSGGAIRNEVGLVIISNSTIIGNRGSRGGGIWGSGTVNITHSTLAGNMGGLGGGILMSGGTLILTHSTLSRNRAFPGEGGGILTSNTTVILTDSTLSDNSALSSGGGIFASGSAVILTNATFANNGANTGTGGGLLNSGSRVILTNATFADNRAANIGGGLATTVGQAVPVNTILARNAAVNGGPDCRGPITSLGHNLIGAPTDCAISLLSSDRTGDPGLGAFVDRGAPGHGRFPLRPDSPAIDAGDEAACPPTDQLDTPRLGPCDIGAIEFYPFVNELVALGNVSTAFDPTPVTGGPVGTFHISTAFTNTSAQAILHPFAEVVELTGGNVLLNAEGGPGGVGARLRPHDSAGMALAPGAMESFEFIIGLQTLAPFTFMIDLLGDPQTAELAQR